MLWCYASIFLFMMSLYLNIIGWVAVKFKLKEVHEFLMVLAGFVFIVFILTTFSSLNIGERYPALYLDHSVNVNLMSDRAVIVRDVTMKADKSGLHDLGFTINYDPSSKLKLTINSVLCNKGEGKINYSVGSRSYAEVYCHNKYGWRRGEKIHLIVNYSFENPYYCYESSSDRVCVFHYKFFDDVDLPIMGGSISINSDKWTAFPSFYGHYVYTKRGPLEIIALGPSNGKEHISYTSNSPYWQANRDIDKYSFIGFISFIVSYPALLWILLYLVISVIIYVVIFYLFGKEENVSAPEVVHSLPEEDIKPWKVNWLYYGKIGFISEDGYKAQLLDWSAEGYIKIEKDGIAIIKRPEDLSANEYDNYLWQTLIYLAKLSGNDNYINWKELRARTVRLSQSKAREVVARISKLTGYYKGVDYDSKARDILVINGLVDILLAVGILLLKFMIYDFAGGPDLMYKVIFMSGLYKILSAATGKYLFIKLKPALFKKYLEWEGFARLLGDYGMISKYHPEDVVMWRKWLIYATALGVADNVIKAIKDLKVNVPNIDNNTIHAMNSLATINAVRNIAHNKAYPSHSSSSSTGSYGGSIGGGFGGGHSIAR